LKIGDQALLTNETGHKLEFKYTGPYTVTEMTRCVDSVLDALAYSKRNNKKIYIYT